MNTPVVTTPARMPDPVRTALLWLPTFVGFPLGGLLAELVVGRVDAPLAAVAGGALTGAVLGAVQWLGLRRRGVGPRWIVATAVGLAVGLGGGAALVGYRTSLASLAAQGAVCGAAVGIAQAGLLRGAFGRLAAAWPAATAALWALGWTVTTAVGVDVEAQYTVFGSTGALTVTVLSAVLPLALARRSGGDRRHRR
jgi:hypothetical protein